jgi:uncharacterized membrane protein YgcG
MGRRLNAFSLVLTATVILLLLACPVTAARAFPIVQGAVTDLPDVISAEDEIRLTQEISNLREFNDMPGLIVITESTGEWDFIEYGHDLFGRLQSQGLTDTTGFLIYISIVDKKLALVLGRDLERIVDPEELRAIRNGLGDALEKGAYVNGLMAALARLGQLTGSSEIEEAKRQRGDWLILAGLIIIVAVLIWNLSKKRRELRKRSE